MNITLLNLLKKLEERLQQNLYKSYDLCDVKSLRAVLFYYQVCSMIPLGKYFLFPVQYIIEHYAGVFRKLLFIRQASFAQANAFMVRGYLQLYKATNNAEYIKKAKLLADEIIQQKSGLSKNSSWGQPYGWFSKKIIRANTPRTTVTSQVMKALLELYNVNKEEEYLHEAESSAYFFIEEMNKPVNTPDQLCFSYTLADNLKVYNANMMAASSFLMLWETTGTSLYKSISDRLYKYTLNHQNNNGSWYYFDLNETPSKIDNYHTGYVLEALMVRKKIMKHDFEYESQLQNGLRFYINNFFKDDIIPKMTPEKTYPIDIQCCAQSIITLAECINESICQNSQLDNIINWTIENMSAMNGLFYYRINKNNKIDKNNYIRWGDAWMHYALSLSLNNLYHD